MHGQVKHHTKLKPLHIYLLSFLLVYVYVAIFPVASSAEGWTSV